MDMCRAWVWAILAIFAATAAVSKPLQEDGGQNDIHVPSDTDSARQLQGTVIFFDSDDVSSSPEARLFPLAMPMSRQAPQAYAIYPAELVIYGVHLSRMSAALRLQLSANLQNLTLRALGAQAAEASTLVLREEPEGFLVVSTDVKLLQEDVAPAFEGNFVQGDFMPVEVPKAVLAVPDVLDLQAALRSVSLTRISLGDTSQEFELTTSTTLEQGVMMAASDSDDGLEWWWWLLIMLVFIFTLICCLCLLWRYCAKPTPAEEEAIVPFKAIMPPSEETSMKQLTNGEAVVQEADAVKPAELILAIENGKKSKSKEAAYEVEIERHPRTPVEMRREVSQAQRKQRRIDSEEEKDAARLMELLSVQPSQPSSPSGSQRSMSFAPLNVPEQSSSEVVTAEQEKQLQQLEEEAQAEASQPLVATAGPLERRRESQEREREDLETRRLSKNAKRPQQRELEEEAWRKKHEEAEERRRLAEQQMADAQEMQQRQDEEEEAREKAQREEEEAKQRALQEEEEARQRALQEEEEAKQRALQEEEEARRKAQQEEEEAKQRALQEEEEAKQRAQQEEEEARKKALQEEEEARRQEEEAKARQLAEKEEMDRAQQKALEEEAAQKKVEEEDALKQDQDEKEAQQSREEEAEPQQRQEQEDEQGQQQEQEAITAKSEEEEAQQPAEEAQQEEVAEDVPESSQAPVAAVAEADEKEDPDERRARAEQMLQDSIEAAPPETSGAKDAIANAEAAGVDKEKLWYSEVRRRRFHKVAELRRLLESCMEDLAAGSRPDMATLRALWQRLEGTKMTQLDAMVDRARTQGPALLQELT